MGNSRDMLFSQIASGISPLLEHKKSLLGETRANWSSILHLQRPTKCYQETTQQWSKKVHNPPSITSILILRPSVPRHGGPANHHG